ncbi:hypothetical protein K432DRAFT_412582, partial [Lepidopterella palustris CBS 459.81]
QDVAGKDAKLKLLEQDVADRDAKLELLEQNLADKEEQLKVLDNQVGLLTSKLSNVSTSRIIASGDAATSPNYQKQQCTTSQPPALPLRFLDDGPGRKGSVLRQKANQEFTDQGKVSMPRSPVDALAHADRSVDPKQPA